MAEITYPSAEKIIEYNLFALSTIRIKKADKAEVLSHAKIMKIVEDCESLEGDIYDKAAFLLKDIIQKHPFASGNRRTAFIVTKYFVYINKKKFAIKDDPSQARVLQGIREGYYSDDEIKRWIQNGTIREFKR